MTTIDSGGRKAGMDDLPVTDLGVAYNGGPMGLLTDAVYGVGAAVLSPIWGWRMYRTGKWRTNWKERFGEVKIEPEPAENRRPTLLIHAVSVGEVNAIRQLVQQLDEATSGSWRIVISTTTDTGIARARQLFEPKFPVVRYPFDFSRSVKKFLDRVKPDMVALVELEVWPNFMEACEKRQIPVCVVNGRLSARSFRRYARIAPLLRSTFNKLTAVAAQTEEYAQRFQYLGVRDHKLAVMDSMKWDTAQIADHVPGSAELARAMGIDLNKPLVVAGSTAPGEDKLLLETIPAEAQLMLVPRKPEWFDDVARLAPGIVRRSEHGDDKPPRPMDGKRLFLLDTMGELRKAYALATVCVVGRSFVKLYGSDMIEPIALGKPTVIGPNYGDFADIMAGFTEAQGIIVTSRPGQAVKELLADADAAGLLAKRGRGVILSRQGSTRRHVELLRSLMPRHSR